MSLDFHKTICYDLLEEDALLVMANGLGLPEIFHKFVRIHVEEDELVFVLNMSPSEQNKIESNLRFDGAKKLPRTISNENNVETRKSFYAKGGLVFVSSTVLILDLLRKTLPCTEIKGFLVYNAHYLTPNSPETFILRIFRQNNKTGFVKAFSEHASSFVHFGTKVQTVMESLGVKKLMLWPRFRNEVKDTLDKDKLEFRNIRPYMTPLMQKTHMSIKRLIDDCLDEIEQANKTTFDRSEFRDNNGYLAYVDRKVKSQLESTWHMLGFKTRQLVKDIQNLRLLMSHLVHYDSITFNRYLEILKVSEFGPQCSWLATDEADEMFRSTRSRVLAVDHLSESSSSSAPNKKSPKKRQKTEDRETDQRSAPTRNPLRLEQPPKWVHLLQILKEIEDDQAKNPSDSFGSGRVLILCKDERTCNQLQELLVSGGKSVMNRLWNQYLKTKPLVRAVLSSSTNEAQTTSFKETSKGSSNKKLSAPESKNKRIVVGSTIKEMYHASQNPKFVPPSPNVLNITSRDLAEVSLSHADSESTEVDLTVEGGADAPPTVDIVEDLMDQDDQESDSTPVIIESSSSSSASPYFPKSQKSQSPLKIEEDEDDMMDDSIGIISEPQIIILPFGFGFNKREMLDEIQPRYIVLYDALLRLVRQIEVYKAENPKLPLDVYFVMLDKSIEEECYLMSLNQENNSFVRLIEEKGSMIFYDKEEQDQETGSGDPKSSQRDEEDLRLFGNTRKGGASLFSSTPTEKPTQQGTVVVDMREFRSQLPSQLHYHGFLVVPVVLEVGDYILTPTICVERKSLSDLYQSFQSGRLYNQTEAMLRDYAVACLLIEFYENQSFHLQSYEDIGREVSLNNIISKIVLLTTQFPRLRLIWSRSPKTTAQIFQKIKNEHKGFEPDADSIKTVNAEGSASHSVIDFLRKLPGVDDSNYMNIINKVENLQELSQMSRAELNELLGPFGGRKLFEFFNESCQGSSQSSSSPMSF